MTGLQAIDDLRTHGAGMPADGFFDAVLAATNDRELAEQLTRDRIAASLRAGETPE